MEVTGQYTKIKYRIEKKPDLLGCINYVKRDKITLNIFQN